MNSRVETEMVSFAEGFYLLPCCTSNYLYSQQFGP